MRLSSDPLSRSPYAESTCSAHPVRPLMSVRPYPVQCEYERAIRWGLCELVEAIALAKFTLGFHVYPYGDRKSQNCSRAYCVGFDSCSALFGERASRFRLQTSISAAARSNRHCAELPIYAK